MTVRLALTGARASGPRPFRYVLDGAVVRFGSTRLTFTGLAAGQHHLTVMLAAKHTVRATRSFDVKAPPPPPPTATSAAPASTATAAPPPPPPTTTSHTTTHSTGNGIPQGPNAGDGDIDNRGGPSDGDGNI